LGLKIRYSLRARQEEIDLLDQVVKHFGNKTGKEVYEKIEKVISQISLNPEMYRASNKHNNLRKCVFSKQTSIYYRFDENHLEIISFRNNRKNPKKFKI